MNLQEMLVSSNLLILLCASVKIGYNQQRNLGYF